MMTNRRMGNNGAGASLL